MSDRKIEGKEPMTNIDPKRVEELDLFLENELAGGFSVEKTREFILSRESQKDEQIARLEAEKREAVRLLKRVYQCAENEATLDIYGLLEGDIKDFLAKSAQQSGVES
jgi:hypothetical protein